MQRSAERRRTIRTPPTSRPSRDRSTRRSSGPLGRLASTADDIAAVIVKAVTTGRPRTRYLINAVAKALVATRALLPDQAVGQGAQPAVRPAALSGAGPLRRSSRQVVTGDRRMVRPSGSRTSSAAIRSAGTAVAVATRDVAPGTATPGAGRAEVPVGVDDGQVVGHRRYRRTRSYWQITVIAVPHFLSVSSSDAVIGPGTTWVIGACRAGGALAGVGRRRCRGASAAYSASPRPPEISARRHQDRRDGRGQHTAGRPTAPPRSAPHPGDQTRQQGRGTGGPRSSTRLGGGQRQQPGQSGESAARRPGSLRSRAGDARRHCRSAGDSAPST